MVTKLLSNNGHIAWMYVGPQKKDLEPKRILYGLAKQDTNNDGLVNRNDRHSLLISDLNGKNLTQITDRSLNALEWIGTGDKLLLKFNVVDEKKDSLFGIFHIKTKQLELTNDTVNTKMLHIHGFIPPAQQQYYGFLPTL